MAPPAGAGPNARRNSRPGGATDRVLCGRARGKRGRLRLIAWAGFSTMLRSPLLTAVEEVERVVTNAWQNPWQAAGLLRFEEMALPALTVLLLASWVLPAAWVVVLTSFLCAGCAMAERVRSDNNRILKDAYNTTFPEKAAALEAKGVVAERARALGLNPDDYEGDEELVLTTGRHMNVTQLGQVVRYYEHAKPLLAAYANKVMLPCVPPEDGGDVEFCRRCTEGKEDIPPVSDEQAEDINRMAPLRFRLGVKLAVWRGQGSHLMSAWTPSTINPKFSSGRDSGVVVWDIPCSSHPALQRMYDLYVEQMAQELQPVGPAWVSTPAIRRSFLHHSMSAYTPCVPSD